MMTMQQLKEAIRLARELDRIKYENGKIEKIHAQLRALGVDPTRDETPTKREKVSNAT